MCMATFTINFYYSFLINAQTEAALMHDAVNLFMSTLSELHLTQKINPKPLHCNETKTWDDGYRLVTYMKVVCVI